MISAERLRELLSYDPETGSFIWKLQAGTRGVKGSAAGSMSSHGYLVIQLDRRTYKAHRLAWLYMTDEWPVDEIDHADLDRANNRWRNLREATQPQNMANRGALPTNTSGFKGVCWHKATGKWTAQIRIRPHRQHLGLFDTAQEAHAAYVAAAEKYHGEFRRTS